MKSIQPVIKQLPNIITSLNLATGCLVIVFAINNRLYEASFLIFIAGLFDFLDGLAARMLKAYSEFGKSLDSLADMVSFGIAPSVILFQLLVLSVQKSDPGFRFNSCNFSEIIQVSSAFLIAIFSAIRLAKFDTDQRQVSSFIGMPTPANAFLIASIPIITVKYHEIEELIMHAYVLVPLACILSILLVSNLPMISLKFKNYSIQHNKARYILLSGSVLLFIWLKFAAFPLIFFLYILVSVIEPSIKSLGKHG